MIRDYPGASTGPARAGQMECSQEIQSLHWTCPQPSQHPVVKWGDILIGCPGLTQWHITNRCLSRCHNVTWNELQQRQEGCHILSHISVTIHNCSCKQEKRYQWNKAWPGLCLHHQNVNEQTVLTSAQHSSHLEVALRGVRLRLREGEMSSQLKKFSHGKFSSNTL